MKHVMRRRSPARSPAKKQVPAAAEAARAATLADLHAALRTEPAQIDGGFYRVYQRTSASPSTKPASPAGYVLSKDFTSSLYPNTHVNRVERWFLANYGGTLPEFKWVTTANAGTYLWEFESISESTFNSEIDTLLGAKYQVLELHISRLANVT